MALDKITMTGATKYTVKQGFTAVNQIIDDLASNEADQGASCIGIEDAAGNFAATTVEDALAEIGDDIESMQTVSDTFDEDTVTTTGLTWGYKGGLLRATSTVTSIADGTVSLTDDTTNYIEIGTDGTVYVVASAFTAGRLPIRTVVCASGVQTTSTDMRSFFSITHDAMLKTGSNLAIGSDADGDMYYRASGALARLAKGAAYYQMAMNAAGTAPKWRTPALTYMSRSMDAATTGAGEASIPIASGANCVLIIGVIPGGAISIGLAVRGGSHSPRVIYNYGALQWNVQIKLVFLYEAPGKSQDFALTAWGESALSGTWTRTGATAAIEASLHIMSW